MRETRHTIIRRLAALVLLSILVYVQGVKAFHRHDVVSARYDTDVTHSVLKAAHDCAVCDYHLCKDAVLPDLPAFHQPLRYYLMLDTVSVSAILTCLPAVHADRGPPAPVC
ncbi:hypothetical protein [Chitinophaga rhizophila]|uniref:Uncharacterized protein n=1 Tax=Chitinophaga rhizophila TaxID=2866212 RepID=A0ABS7G5P1_9BACT|nr:hypothetical protein [Chitinophaga rhizophila]MBW8682954.1 hypothetical protein [Chitinophaga rhizophila]